ncbi:MAG TPA: hypothetical protein VJ748_06600 [Vitreimonas sp.]|jgi:hypothetical protein|nr:hypothetical protein [Vitreimonas sp.]
MVEMDQRLPDLSDKELESLHANAVRLAASGAPQQRQQAESLLPLIEAQMETRRAARVAAQASRAKPQRRSRVREDTKE